MTFFERHRIALAGHVQRAMTDVMPTDRSARRHLQTLVAHGDLDVRSDGAVGGRNVYQLTKRGLRRAFDAKGDGHEPTSLRPISRSRQDHELLITEWAVSLLESVRARPDLSLAGLLKQLPRHRLFPEPT